MALRERERNTFESSPWSSFVPVCHSLVLSFGSGLVAPTWCKLCFWNASCTQVIAGYPNALPETFHTTNKCSNAYPAIGPVLHRVQHCNARHWKMRCTVGLSWGYPSIPPAVIQHQAKPFQTPDCPIHQLVNIWIFPCWELGFFRPDRVHLCNAMLIGTNRKVDRKCCQIVIHLV